MEEQSSSEIKCNSVSSGDNFTMAKPSMGVASSSSNSLLTCAVWSETSSKK